jgi:hypothetical protein
VRRRLLGLVGVGIVAGAAYERWVAHRRDRLDVYFADGCFVTYVDGSAGGEQLLPLARQVLSAVQG